MTAGAASINVTAPGRLDIHQQSDKAIIDWRSFSIATGEQTHFQQPSAAAIALNRVNGISRSQIDGILSANGQLFLINPNGVIFGHGSEVSVAGLVASTADIANEDFLAGRFVFDQASDNPDAMVANLGHIRIADGGFAVLAAPTVRNEGVINARLGQVELAGANTFTLDFEGDGLLSFGIGAEVTETPLDENGEPVSALVSNDGSIFADGGVVSLTAHAADSVVEQVINMEGIVQARAVDVQGGTVILTGGDHGITAVAGTLDASGDEPGQTGGTVKILGENVGLYAGTEVLAGGASGGGEVLVGGNLRGEGPEPNASNTYVDPNASIRASAIGNGDGGTVILWADGITRFHGSIEARGGQAGGDGGFVETSGKAWLDSTGGRVDAGSRNGSAGTWLLDPGSVEIRDRDTGAGSSDPPVGGINVTVTPGDPTVFEAVDDNPRSVVFTDDIQSSLNTNTSVSIIAEEIPDVDDGSIEVINSIIRTAGNDPTTLTLQADGSITINTAGPDTANIQSIAGPLNVDLQAGNIIDILGPASIETAGGSIKATGNSFRLGFDSTLNSANGDITIAAGSVALFDDGSTVTTSGGSLTITAKQTDIRSGDFVTRINTGGGVAKFGDGNDVLIMDGVEVLTVGGNLDIDVSSIQVLFGSLLDTTSASSTDGNFDLVADSVNVLNNSEITTGRGNLSITQSCCILTIDGKINTTSGNIILTADDIALNSNASVGSSGGTLRIQPLGQTEDIHLGQVVAPLGTLVLDNAELGRIQNGFREITIGRDDGMHNITIDAATFQDPVVIQSPTGGSIQVQRTDTGPLTPAHGLEGTDDASLTLIGPAGARWPDEAITIDASLETNGESISIEGGNLAFNSLINANGGDITLTIDELLWDARPQSAAGGELLIQPLSAERAIRIDESFFLEIEALQIPPSSILEDGFELITIGRENGAHEITVDAVRFQDPVLIRTPNGGSITVQSTSGPEGDPLPGISMSGPDSSLTLQGSGATTILMADIVTEGGALVIDDSVRLAATVVLDTTQGAAGGGDISILGSLDDTAPGSNGLTLTAGGGNVVFLGNVGVSATLGPVTISSANDVTMGGKFNAGATIVQHGGQLNALESNALDVTSLFVQPEANGATLFGTVAGKSGTAAALAVEGPIGDPDFTINDCVIGVSCLQEPPVVFPPQIPPYPRTPVTSEPILTIEIPEIVTEWVQRPPSGDPRNVQYSNFGNEELWQ